MAHRVAFTRLLLAGSHSAVVVPPRSSSGSTHSAASKGQRCSLPGTSSRDGALRPCRHPADAQLSTQEVMPPPQVGSLRQGSSKGVFFSPPPPWVTNHMAAAGFPTCWHTVPVQHSHAGTANLGKCTQARQSLSPTCPGLPRRSPPWRGGQGCPQGHHHLHAHP